jgi:hypothetical protein
MRTGDGLPGDAEDLSLPMASSPWEEAEILHPLVNRRAAQATCSDRFESPIQ